MFDFNRYYDCATTDSCLSKLQIIVSDIYPTGNVRLARNHQEHDHDPIAESIKYHAYFMWSVQNETLYFNCTVLCYDSITNMI